MAESENRGALNLLAAYYSSGDSSEEEVPGPRVSTKRSSCKDWDENKCRAVKTQCTDSQKSLPLPENILSLYETKEDVPLDDPSEHEGRIRSFPHERGNWVSYVYISYDPGPVLHSFMDVLVTYFENDITLNQVKDMHISLTKTVVLRHHWIDSFVDSVRQSLQGYKCFSLNFGSLSIYTNDEKTRTFIGLDVNVGQEILKNIVSKLDKCLEEFRLPKFYENPAFHMSIVWCVGDKKEVLQSQMTNVELVLHQFMYAHPTEWSLKVDELKCKSGNKSFSFRLS